MINECSKAETQTLHLRAASQHSSKEGSLQPNCDSHAGVHPGGDEVEARCGNRGVTQGTP